MSRVAAIISLCAKIVAGNISIEEFILCVRKELDRMDKE